MPVLRGKAYFARITKDNYDAGNTKIKPSYNMSLLLEDKDQLKIAKDADLNIKEPTESVPGKYVTLKSTKLDTPPRIVDDQKNEFNRSIGNGSEVNVSFYSNKYDPKKPASGVLLAVQVLNHVDAGSGIDDFSVVGDTAAKGDFNDSIDDVFKS